MNFKHDSSILPGEVQKPNILIFNLDQFRADALGHMGNDAAITPNMDIIGTKEGVPLRYAFCQNHVCTPSRCSFMSGWYPHVRGHRSMNFMMQKDEPVLLKTLKDNGYTVWWGGKNDLVPADSCSLYDYCDIYHKPKKQLMPRSGDASKWRGEPGGDNYYSFYGGVNFIASASTNSNKAFREKIKSLEIHKKTGCKMEMITEVINPIIRGWINYFCKYNPQATKYSLGCVDRRLVKWAMCKFKRFRGHRKKAEIWLSEVKKREPNLFAHWQYRNRSVVMS